MKNKILGMLLLQLILAGGANEVLAKNINEVAEEIANRNLELQGYAYNIKADSLERRAANSLGETTVEFSPFFFKRGISESELIVSQEFEWPGIYGARRFASDVRTESERVAIKTRAWEIKREVKDKCIELMMLRKLSGFHETRIAFADSLLKGLEKKFNRGEVTLLDLNRVKMDRMSLQTEIMESRGRENVLLSQLAALNGGKTVDCSGWEYPELPDSISLKWLDEQLQKDPMLAGAQAGVEAEEAEMEVAKMQRWPSLKLGYRMNTDHKKAVHGMMVGVGLPIFTGNRNVNAAKVRVEAARLNVEAEELNARRRQQEVLAEYNAAMALYRTYDAGLMQQTVELLDKSLIYGNISVSEYYPEMDKVHQSQQEHLMLQYKLNQLYSQLSQE